MQEGSKRFGSARAQRLSEASMQKLKLKNIDPGQVIFPLRTHEKFLQKLAGETTEMIVPGVTLVSYPHELGDGDYVNVYSISAEPQAHVLLEVASSVKPIYQRKRFRDPSVLAATSGGYFYLSDDGDYEPIEYTFNLCVRNGTLASLPTVTRNALVTHPDGTFTLKEIEARGSCSIGGKSFAWVGGRESSDRQLGAQCILYGPACCSMMITDDPVTGQKRVVDRDKNMTPKNDGRVDVVVIVKNGMHQVAEIHDGGGTDFFAGTYILSMHPNDASGIRVGEQVVHEQLGGLKVTSIYSAISVGPSLSDARSLDTDAHLINHDASFGEKVFNLTSRVPRSTLFQDSAGELYMRIFDGGKSEHGKGITPLEVLEEIESSLAKKGRTLSWGVHLDGGKSSHIMHKTPSGELDAHGVLYYERWPDKKFAARSDDAMKGNFFLVGPEGRRSASHVVLKTKAQ